MARFKVVEIVSGTTLRVTPEWKFAMPDGSDIFGDLIKVAGIVFEPRFSAPVKRRFEIFLLGERVEAYKPTLTKDELAPIECKITLDDTDVIKYFPELGLEPATRPNWWQKIIHKSKLALSDFFRGSTRE